MTNTTPHRGVTLLSAATANGTGGYQPWNYNSEKAICVIGGTFNGATVKVEAKVGGLSGVPVYTANGTEFSANSPRTVELPVGPGCEYQANVTSAGASTSITMLMLAGGY